MSDRIADSKELDLIRLEYKCDMLITTMFFTLIGLGKDSIATMMLCGALTYIYVADIYLHWTAK